MIAAISRRYERQRLAMEKGSGSSGSTDSVSIDQLVALDRELRTEGGPGAAGMLEVHRG